MRNPFVIDKSFKIRHKILEVLYQDADEHEQADRMIGSIKIAKKANIPITDVHTWQSFLVQEGEIASSDNDGQFMMSILLAGKNAYVGEKYIKAGIKERWDGIYDWARIVIPIAALVISIITIILNNSLSNRVNKIEQTLKSNK